MNTKISEENRDSEGTTILGDSWQSPHCRCRSMCSTMPKCTLFCFWKPTCMPPTCCTTLQALCTHPTDTFQTWLIRPNYPSQLWHSSPKQSFFLHERVRVESYKPSFLLENPCLQELNDFSNVKQNSFRKWADFQRNCQKVTRTCDTDRSATTALQRGKLCESHQAATIFIRSYQSTVKQTVTNLIAILIANSTIFSWKLFCNYFITRKHCMQAPLILLMRRHWVTLCMTTPEFVSFVNETIFTSQVIRLSKQRIWHTFSCRGVIYITINVMKITVHQSLISLAENSQ